MHQIKFRTSAIICILVLAISFIYMRALNAKNSTLRIGILNPPLSLQSWKIRDGASTIIGRQIHRGLLTTDSSSGALTSFAASKWTFSADNQKIDFTLNRGLKFHDGSRLACADVLSTFKRLNQHGVETSIHLPSSIKFSCVSDSVFRMEFSEPVPASLFDSLASSAAGITKSDGLIGLGPYKIESVSKDMIVLESYAHGTGFRTLEFVVGTSDVLSSMFKAHELDDILYLGFFQDTKVDCQPISGLAPSSFWFNINSRSWVFSKMENRKAMQSVLRYAASKTEIFNGEKLSSSLIPFGVPGYEPRDKSRIPSEREFLSSLKHLRRESVRAGRIPLHLRESNRYQYDWDRFVQFVDPENLIFEVHYLSNKEYFERYYRGEVGVSFLGANISRNDPFEVLSYFRSQDKVNSAGIHEKFIDLKALEAARSSNAEEIKALAIRSNKWLIDNAYVEPLFSKRFKGCVQKGLSGYELTPLGPLSIDYSRVH